VRGADAQGSLERFVEIANGEGGHALPLGTLIQYAAAAFAVNDRIATRTLPRKTSSRNLTRGSFLPA
jgi:hypothetical protein